MRIYLAAPWTCRDAIVARAVQQIEAAGHTLTERWWTHTDVNAEIGTPEIHDELSMQAAKDITGVWNAQVFLLLNVEKSEGKAVEMGLALAYGTPIIVVGKPSNVFHYLQAGITIVPDVETALAHIRDMEP